MHLKFIYESRSFIACSFVQKLFTGVLTYVHLDLCFYFNDLRYHQRFIRTTIAKRCSV